MDIENIVEVVFWSLVYWIRCQHHIFSQDSGQASKGGLTNIFRYVIQLFRSVQLGLWARQYHHQVCVILVRTYRKAQRNKFKIQGYYKRNRQFQCCIEKKIAKILAWFCSTCFQVYMTKLQMFYV